MTSRREFLIGTGIGLASLSTAHLGGAFKKVRPQTDPQLLERFRQWQLRMS